MRRFALENLRALLGSTRALRAGARGADKKEANEKKRSAHSIRPNDKSPLASGDCAHDEERLGAGRNRLRQRRICRIVRDVFAAGKESYERPALLRDVIADRATKHRIFCFQRVENRTLRDLIVKFEFHFAANVRQCAQMMRKNDANHGSFIKSQ